MEPSDRSYRASVTRINICGTIFQCYSEILNRFKDSKLACLHKYTNNYDSCRNEYYFDRNPIMFNYILDACRKGVIHLPKDMCGASFSEELKFWELSPSHVAPCCWEALYRNESEASSMRKLSEYLQCNSTHSHKLHGLESWKKKLWLFLEEPSSSITALIWGSFISLLIIMSTITEALATLPAFTVNFTESEKSVMSGIATLLGLNVSTTSKVAGMKPHPYLMYTDACCHLVLTLDFMMAFLVCPKRKLYMFSYIRIVVLLGYMSFWIAFILEMNFEALTSIASIRVYLVFKYLSVLQLARLFYLTKRIPAFKTLALTFFSSIQELKVLMFMLGILMFIFGFIMFVAEMFHSSKIDNIFVAMYWSLITLTTVGYGDYYPDTVAGHVIAGACAVCGVLVLALPIGVIASSFYTLYNFQKYAETHIHRYGRNSTPADKEI